jgi:hypothetical protein
MLKRVVGAAAVLAMWFGGYLPTWLLVAMLVAAIPLGMAASVRQKRLENRFVSAAWQAAIRRRS